HVLVFTLGLSVFSGLLFGLAPALKMASPTLQSDLKEAGRGFSGGRHRVQRTFVIAETALALILLVGAGLLIRSLVRLWNVDPGFSAHNVLTVGVSLSPAMAEQPPDAIRAAFRELDGRIAAIPGVTAVSQTWGALPMAGDDEQTFWFEGQAKPASEKDKSWAIDYIVEPGYLRAMEIPLLRGRFFAEQDNEKSPRVIVVDDVFARKFFPNEDPIGKRILSDNFSGPAEIVGVVGHVKQWGLDADDSESLRAQFYLSCMQMPDAFIKQQASGSAVIMRSGNGTVGLVDAVRRASQEMSREQLIFAPLTMDSIISDTLADRRFSMTLLSVFATLALLLAAIGLYGVISYVVAERTHEIGIRIALGARQPDVLRMVLGAAARWSGVGIGVGLVLALLLTRLMSRLLYGVAPADPLTFVAVPSILILVSLFASYLPARRAMKVDPVTALRYQ
ncbi:MAG TPA: FtsX-like permease family protein, partial [Patescibacteria group bacterium]|nr:FtsX-like permease family protein [Patescibacteria group bacterium]